MESRKVAKAIWLSYDFGLRADYESLFAWLDNLKAKECGNGMAYFKYLVPEDKLEKTLFLEFLKEDIKNAINLTQNDRLYIVWRDSHSHKILGEFLFGNRKSPMWAGYGNKSDEETRDEE